MLHRPSTLSESDFGEIAALEQRVVAADGGRLKLSWPHLRQFPSEHVTVLLHRDGPTLTGFAAAYTFLGPTEVAGMVDPAARRRGVGGALLDALRADLADSGVRELLLICPRTGAGGAELARSRGGITDHAEHALVLRGRPRPAPVLPGVRLRPSALADAETVGALVTDGFGFDPGPEQATRDGATVIELDGEPIGFLRSELDGGRGDIYGFVVRADLRGRGIGRDVLCRVTRDLLRRGADTVGLEVETANEHAIGLYLSVGFERLVTEDYYRLVVPR